MKVRKSSLLIMSVLVLLALTACEDEKSDVETKRQLDVLKQMAADTPAYPGFGQFREDARFKGNTANVSRCYTARVNEGDVERFYKQLFESQGWKLTKEERSGGLFSDEKNYVLTFEKNSYAITLTYANVEANSGRCDYTLIYYFNRPTPLIDLGMLL